MKTENLVPLAIAGVFCLGSLLQLRKTKQFVNRTEKLKLLIIVTAAFTATVAFLLLVIFD